MGPSHRSQGFVGALEDALGTDIDPASGCHLAVHGQPFGLQTPELIPGGPVRNDQGIGQEDPGGLRMSLEHGHRLPGLHDQRLVVFQVFERLHDGPETLPVPGRLPRPSVDDELFGLLADLRIEVVHQHPERSLLRPALGLEFCPPWGSDLSVFIIFCVRHACLLIERLPLCIFSSFPMFSLCRQAPGHRRSQGSPVPRRPASSGHGSEDRP